MCFSQPLNPRIYSSISLCVLSRAALRVPGMPSAPGVRASHRQATRAGSEQRWGRQGRGARAGQEPSTPEVPAADPGPERAAQGCGASGTRGRCGGRWRGPEQPRSGERTSEGARRGSEGAASEGSASGAVTGTATGVKGAQLQEAGPPRRRTL